MPASKAEQVLDALKALLETIPVAVVERSSVLPEKIPDDSLDGRRLISQAFANGLLDPYAAGSSYPNTRGMRLLVWTNPS